jgi:hypothetical protein
MAKVDPETCRVCKRHYRNHTRCEVCGFALEHTDKHPDGKTTEEEWEGLALMAVAGLTGGRPLTDAETKAIKRYPSPARLTIDGYRRPNGVRPPWALK